MKPKKFFCLLAGLCMYALANAQYSGLEIYTGLGLPLYSEKSFPEKYLEVPGHQACPSLERPGYYNEGKPSFLVGTSVGYSFGDFTFRAGLSYVFYQKHTWANPDSALKYAIPLCPDPYVDRIAKYQTISFPVGFDYTFGKFQCGIFYAIPLVTQLSIQTSSLNGVIYPWLRTEEWFYKSPRNINGNDFYGITASYKLIKNVQVVVSYLYNGTRYLNHLNFGFKYNIYNE